MKHLQINQIKISNNLLILYNQNKYLNNKKLNNFNNSNILNNNNHNQHLKQIKVIINLQLTPTSSILVYLVQILKLLKHNFK